MSSLVVMLATLLASTKPALADIGIIALGKRQVVNGEGDSTDGTRYTYHCLSDKFKCRDQLHCVKASAICDGIPDCHDRFHEEACTRYGAGNFSQISSYEECEDHLFKCFYDTGKHIFCIHAVELFMLLFHGHVCRRTYRGA